MAHKVTAVVHDPKTNNTVLVETEVGQWYEALDMVIHTLTAMNPGYWHKAGVDHLQVRAITIMHVAD